MLPAVRPMMPAAMNARLVIAPEPTSAWTMPALRMYCSHMIDWMMHMPTVA